METKNKFNSFLYIIQSRVLSIHRPVAVRWNLTNRCNLNCSYCNLSKIKSEELGKENIFKILRELREIGTQRISFSGGEPLIREDIGKIIDFTKSLGISSSINTNGILIPEKIDQMKNLDLVKISIDGPEKIHNKQRGNYKKTIKGLEELIEKNMKTTICTTLTKHNISHINYFMEKSLEYKTTVAIQLVSNLEKNMESAKELLPTASEIRSAAKEMKKFKKLHPDNLRNSWEMLDVMEKYPKKKFSGCSASKIFCMIMPDGTMTPCDRIKIKNNLPNLKNTSVKNAFKNLPRPECSGCYFCGSMELNHLYNLNPKILKEVFNITN